MLWIITALMALIFVSLGVLIFWSIDHAGWKQYITPKSWVKINGLPHYYF